jgi:tape measure domain-containing protein
MALQLHGVELVVKNFNQFISQIGRSDAAVRKSAKTAETSAKRITDANRRLGRAQREQFAAQERNLSIQSKLRKAHREHVAVIDAAIKKTEELRVKREALAQQGLWSSQINKALKKDTDDLATTMGVLADKESAVEAARLASINSSNRLTDATENLAVAEYALAAAEAAAALGATGLATAIKAVMAAIAPLVAALAVVVAVLTAGFIALVKAAQLVWNVFKGLVSAASKLAIFLKNVLLRAVNLIIGAFKGLLSIIERVTRPIRNFFSQALAVTVGMGIRDAIRSISNQVRELISTMGEALGLFQKLDLQFQAIIARDMSREMGIDVARGFKLAGVFAQNLFNWVRNIALTTPFSFEKVSTTVAMANAMGLTLDQAKKLTLAVGNFTAAMGLSEEHMFRIIYNFGQMLAQGKLNGREFRDLANSFVPVWDMMRRMGEQAGMTAQEFKELAFAGGVPVEEFFNEFIDMANRDFPGAMERMGRTIQGVTARMKNFFQTVLGLELLGPVFNKMTGVAADALDKLLSPAVLEASDLIGRVLAQAFDILKPQFDSLIESILELGNAFAKLFGFVAPTVTSVTREIKLLGGDTIKVVDETSNAVDRFATAIMTAALLVKRGVNLITAKIEEMTVYVSTNLEGLRGNAEAWGYNVVASFANGMAAAAALIANVINQIAELISGWLSASSPPKALPDLPKWGMAAMREWLKGFTQADFSILKGIQGPLKDALDLLERTGEIGKNTAGRIFANVSKAIAKALAGGGLGQGVFNQIAKAAGPFGKDIVELAKRFIAYGKAVEQVEAAQRALKEAQDAVRIAEAAAEAARNKEERSRVNLATSIREYNKQLREGASKAVLNIRLKEIRAGEQAAKQATKERKAAESRVTEAEKAVEIAQAALDVAKEYLDVIQEQLDNQKELVAQLLDLTEAQIIEIDVDKKAAGAAAAAIADIGAAVGKTTNEIKEHFKSLIKPLRKNLDQIVQDALDNVDLILQSFTDLGDSLGLLFDPLIGEDGSLKELETAWGGMFGDGGVMREVYQNFLDWFLGEQEISGGPLEGGQGGGRGGGFVDAQLLTFLVELRDVMKDIAEEHAPRFEFWLGEIEKALKAVVGDDVTGAQGLARAIGWVVERFLDFIGMALVVFNMALLVWGGFMTIKGVIDEVITKITELNDWFIDQLQEIVNFIEDPLGTTIDNIKTNYLDPLLSYMQRGFAIGVTLFIANTLSPLTLAFGLVVTVVMNLFTWLGKVISKADTALKKLSKVKTLQKNTGTNTNDPPTCFIAGTLINIPGGLAGIESINVGDVVWSFDEDAGVVVPGNVTKIFENDATNIYHIRTTSGDLTCTPHHRFFVNGGWVEACDLKPNDAIHTIDGVDAFVIETESMDGDHVVYNFTVDMTHTYFVEGHCVHNAKRAAGGPVSPGTPYLVGEKGWEMFVPWARGFIYNQSQLSDMFKVMTHQASSVAMAGVAAPAAGVNIYFGGVSIYDQMTLAEFEGRVRQVMMSDVRGR